jgi:hypothetical protein
MPIGSIGYKPPVKQYKAAGTAGYKPPVSNAYKKASPPPPIATPQQDERSKLDNYQYNVMARNPSAMNIRTQTRYYGQREVQYRRQFEGTTGNVYSAAKWRGGPQGGTLTELGRYDPYALQRRKAEAATSAEYDPSRGYFGNQLMQRFGGDKSITDRLSNMMSYRARREGVGFAKPCYRGPETPSMQRAREIYDESMKDYLNWLKGGDFADSSLGINVRTKPGLI